MSDVAGWPTFGEWRSALSPIDRDRVDALTELLRTAGASEPESWARSEVAENIAQAARYAFLRAVWRDLDRWRDPEFVDAFVGARDVGVSKRTELRHLVAEIAFRVSLDLVMVIDHGEDIDGIDGLPGWVLMETDENCTPTGRDVGGLHESFLEVDPLGTEAEDIRGW